MKLGNLSPSMGATKSTKRKGRGPGSGHGTVAGFLCRWDSLPAAYVPRGRAR